MGARQTIKAEIETPNSFGNLASDKASSTYNSFKTKAAETLDDIFNNRPKPQTELVTPEGIRIKVNVEENTFAKPVQPADDLNSKIVTVDSQGNPSGTRFRSDYENHIKNRDFTVPRKKGIGGAHDINELNKYINEINIIKVTPHPKFKEIYEIEYQMPALDRTGTPTGQWRNRNGNEPFRKTVYDSKIISDSQMMEWGRQAYSEAQSSGRAGSREWTGYAPNGLKFHGYIDDLKTSSVRGFHVEF